MRIGIICEGSTDFAILEIVAQSLIDADECVLLQPDFDRLRSGPYALGTGWQGVRKFLGTSAVGLALGIFDIIVIQVDASVRRSDEMKKAGLRKAAPTESDLDPFCDHVKGWATQGLPSSAVVVLPREEMESWLVAANTNIKDVEALTDPAEELAARGLIPQVNGRPEKLAATFRELGRPLARLATDSKKRAKIVELERFVGKLKTLAKKTRVP